MKLREHRVTRAAAGLIAAVLAVTGCRDEGDWPPEQREPYEELATAADTAREFAVPEDPVAVVPVQGGRTVEGALTATGHFRSPGDRVPPGALTLTEVEGQTRVQVTLLRFAAETELQTVVTLGRCDEEGQLVQSAGAPVRVAAEGVADLDTSIAVPTQTLLDGRHSVRLVTPEAATERIRPQEVAACADLPRVD